MSNTEEWLVTWSSYTFYFRLYSILPSFEISEQIPLNSSASSTPNRACNCGAGGRAGGGRRRNRSKAISIQTLLLIKHGSEQ